MTSFLWTARQIVPLRLAAGVLTLMWLVALPDVAESSQDDSSQAGSSQAVTDAGAAGQAVIDAAVARGEAIAREAQDRGDGFTDMRANARMTLTNDRGQEAVRELQIAVLDLPGDASRSLTLVDEPKDVRGTALLTHTHESGDDEQWLYLPAVKRVKRIASTRKSGPFMGSEFTYEDFSAQLPQNYHFRLEREEACLDVICWVLERRPKDPSSSGYGRQLVWMDQPHYRIHRVEYYDRMNNHLKTLTVADFKLYKDTWWRGSTLRMLNHQTRAVTTLAWSGIEFDVGFTERDFDIASLKAAR